MSEKLKTICLIAITIAIVVSVVFYCWSIYENWKIDKMKLEISRLKTEIAIMTDDDVNWIKYLGKREAQNFKQHLFDLFNR